MNFRKSVLFTFCAAVLAVCGVARADQVSHARIVRLSFVEGDVAYQISSGGTWQRALMNLPIQQNFSLRTDAGYAEVEFESGLVIRLARNTQVEFPELSLIDGRKVTSVKLDSGTIIATADVAKTDQFTVTVGNLDITAPKNGRFRVDADGGQDWVTVFHGKVEVADSGKTQVVDNGNTLHDAGDAAGITTEKSAAPDAFDKWVTQRDESQLNSQSAAGEFASQKNYPGTLSDLYDYGLWFNVPGYGMAWQPYGLGPGWMPFGAGEWMFFDGGFGGGWNWISAEPWGWLPYHYGAWIDLPGEGWFWFPQNMGVFMPANASFVNVAGATGWTPVLATPTNPAKARLNPTSPIHVVLAGTASNGVITAGMRGQANQGTVTRSAGVASSFSQAASPSVLQMMTAGVKVTALASQNHARLGAVAASSSQAGMSAPAGGRPAMLAPHASAVAVTRPPSTFAHVATGNGANSSGVRQVSGNATAVSPVGGGSTMGGNSSSAHGASGPSTGASAGSTSHVSAGTTAGGSTGGKH